MTTDPSVDFVMVFNDTTNDTLTADPYGQPQEVSRATPWVLAVLIPIAMLVILIGNTLVVVAVLKVRVLQTIQNYYLVSLAASDLMVGGLIMPLALMNELMGYWSLGRIMCDIHVTLDIFACTASILNLCAIGLDRHYAITQAVKYTATKTTKHAIGGIAMVWTASTIICLPPLLGWGTDSFHPGLYPRCDYTDNFIYVLYSTVGSFFGPLPIMLVVYTRIFIAARSRIRKLRKRSGIRRSTSITTANLHRLEAPEGKNAQTRSKEGKGKEIKLKAGISSCPLTAETINEDTPPTTPGVLIRPEKLTAVYSKHALNNSGKQAHKNGTSSHHAPQGFNEKPTDFHRSAPLTDVEAVSLNVVPREDPVLKEAKERRWKMMQAKERRLTIVICIVTGAFVTCWSPFFVAYVVRTVHESLVSPALFRGFVWLGYCNSALNPIIYTLLNTDFRQAFQQVLIRKFSAPFCGGNN